MEDTLIKKSREYNRLLQMDPHDISAWIAFIDFQDEYQRLSSKQSHQSMTPILEKKVASRLHSVF